MAAKAVRTEKLDLRVTAVDNRTLKAAATVSRRSLTDFVRESALARADETLADRRTFHLSPENWTAFLAALDSAPRPLPRLHRLLREPPFLHATVDRCSLH